MSSLQALWLGIVQGLTEFFPVSSSGHLVVFETLLGARTGGGLLFEVAVHVATLLAIVVVYRRRIGGLVRDALRGRAEAWDYVAKLAVGTVPAVAVGLLAKDWIEEQFSAPALVGGLLLVTGTFVWTTKTTAPSATRTGVGFGDALWIGVAQAFAILPGISRSGATVSMALALGIAPAVAAEFSFLLGVVAITGAAVLTLPELGSASPQMLSAVGVGGAAALVSGLFAIWLFLRMLERRSFHWFALWAWAAGAGFLLWLWA